MDENNENQNNERQFFWEGNVGVKLEMKTNKKTGEQFPTFEPVRCYKGSDDGGPVSQEERSYPVDDSPFLKCPRCDGDIQENATHFTCLLLGW